MFHCPSTVYELECDARYMHSYRAANTSQQTAVSPNDTKASFFSGSFFPCPSVTVIFIFILFFANLCL